MQTQSNFADVLAALLATGMRTYEATQIVADQVFGPAIKDPAGLLDLFPTHLDPRMDDASARAMGSVLARFKAQIPKKPMPRSVPPSKALKDGFLEEWDLLGDEKVKEELNGMGGQGITPGSAASSATAEEIGRARAEVHLGILDPFEIEIVAASQTKEEWLKDFERGFRERWAQGGRELAPA